MRQLLIIISTAALWWPAAAAAHPPTAHAARDIGPGTVIWGCHRPWHHWICHYSTPAINVGIETEDPHAVWTSWLEI